MTGPTGPTGPARATGATGTGRLTRLALRRDQVMVSVWVYAFLASVASTAYSYKHTYKTGAGRAHFAYVTNHTAGTLALTGRVYDSSLGGLVTWKIGMFGAVMAAVMSVFLVIRHTRAEEETGRLELVGAGAVGRRAPLTAALAVALIADLAIAVVTTAVLAAFGMPVSGAAALGLAWAATGLVFAGVAAVTAQLGESARTARGIAFGVLLAGYLLRVVGDTVSATGPRWPSWTSPLGWSQQVRSFGAERWWVFGLFGALLVALVAGAYALAAERDLGAGLIPARPGPATASPRFRGAFALAWRMQRGPLLAWAVAFAAFGVSVGGLTTSVNDMIGGSTSTRNALLRLGRGVHDIGDAYLVTVMGFFGVAAGVYAVMAVLRLRSEESAQRAEPLLATTIGRIRWAASHLVFAVFGTAAILALAGLGVGVAYGVSAGDLGTQVPRLAGAGLAQAPAALVLAGVAVALFGCWPRATVASWGAIGFCVLLGELGPVLKFGQALLGVSPFTHVPKIPGGPVSATPLIALAAIAAALIAAGLYAFRRRDLAG